MSSLSQSLRSPFICVATRNTRLFPAMLVLAAVGSAADGRGAEDTPPAKPKRPPVVVTEETRAFHRDCLVFDGHNDLPWSMRNKAGSSFKVADIAKEQDRFHTDIPRLREGGVGAIFWSVYVPPDTLKEKVASHQVLEQIDLVYRMLRHYPDTFELAKTADDVTRIRKAGKIASLIGLEGGHAIEDSLSLLRMYHQLGARYMTLAHSDTLDWVDSATDEARHGGITDFGRSVVETMNEIGMLVDISHISADAMRAVLKVAKAPVIASHSSAFAIAPHPRNVPDDVLLQVKENRGVIMVNFYSAYVVPEAVKSRIDVFQVERELEDKFPDPKDFKREMDKWYADHPVPPGTIHDLVDHIDHIVKTAGIDHVGLGSDFDGVPKVPHQLDDVSCFPNLTQALVDRGYKPADIRKILGENALRALREVEEIAARRRNKE